MRILRNSLSALIATGLTLIALYVGIQVAAGPAATSDGSTGTAVALAGQTYMCPQTGCTATNCHGATGSRTGSATTSASSYQGDGSSGGSGTGVMTCPRTGCTATSCHGASGSPPPSSGSGGASGMGGGYGRHSGQYSAQGGQGSSGDVVFE